MKWILILFVSSWNAGGPAMQEFNSKQACDVALYDARQLSFMGPHQVDGVCVPKGAEK